MKNNHIDICGITPQCELPQITDDYPFSEICETNKLHISKCNPNIETIVQLSVETSIKKRKVLDTHMGKRLIVYGVLHIKIFYVADKTCQNVYYAYYEVPFYTFVKLGKTCKNIADVRIYIEDTIIDKIDPKTFLVSCLIFVCPIFKKEIHSKDIGNKKNDEYPIGYKKNHKKECDISFNSGENDVIECKIEYDMNSDTSLNNYSIEKKGYFESE
jgi:hypothetical protein